MCVRTCTRVATNAMVCAACPGVLVGTSCFFSCSGSVPTPTRHEYTRHIRGLQITDSHSTVYSLRTVRGILHDNSRFRENRFSRTPPSAPLVFVLQRFTLPPTRLPHSSTYSCTRARWSVRCGTAGTQRGRASGRGLRTDTAWVRPQYDPALRTRQSSHPTADRNWANWAMMNAHPPVKFKCLLFTQSASSPYHSHPFPRARASS